jgi:hypothetical protein
MAFTATLAAAAVSVGTAYLFVKALVVADNNLFVFLPLIILATFVLSFIGTLFAVTYCRFRIVEESHKIKDDSQAFDQYQY